MINTTLLNKLREQEIDNITSNANLINFKINKALFHEKIKIVLIIIGLIFICLLLMIILYKIYSYSANCSALNISTKKVTEKPIQKYTPSVKHLFAPKQTNTNISKNDNKLKYSDGVEYVKFNNHIYKRVWENGFLKEVKMLEKNIEQSRKKTNEKIPQFSIPNEKG